MTDSPIQPSIGRVVLVRAKDPNAIGGSEEAPSIVNGVHGPSIISVCVMPYGMAPYSLSSIEYLQDGDLGEDQRFTWRWMPYQLETAAK